MNPLLLALAVLSYACHAPVPSLHHPAYEPDLPGVFRAEANVFLKAKVTASAHWSNRVPAFAVDGRHDNAGNHWAAENIPVQLTVHLAEPKSINTIRLWTYWGGGRHYRYCVEGSLDGKQWTALGDRRDNQTPATAAGEIFHFDSVRVGQVRTTFTHNSASQKAGGHIVEIEGYQLTAKQRTAETTRLDAWKQVPDGLQAAFGSIDERYSRHDVPAIEGGDRWSVSAWRGERVHGQLVLWTSAGAKQVRVSSTPLVSEAGQRLPASVVKPRFVRYVLAKGKLVADVLDTASRLDIEKRTVRPVWVSVDVPVNAQPGVYRGQLQVAAAGQEALALEVKTEVQPMRLSPPAEWPFHLDLWQNPYSVARYHRVEPWSKEHDALLRPQLRLLASAGQKCVTATIIHDPWVSQTYDPHESMVEWIRDGDGKCRFDFSAFDHYVELCMECGIERQINCYSMVPWIGTIRYQDAKTGDYARARARLGHPEYEALWRPFLTAFAAHLKQKGWLDRTCIAMDEIPLKRMLPFIAFVEKAAPGIKLALAGKYYPELRDRIHDWCLFITPPLAPDIARARVTKGLPTTFYVCCGPGRPNTFTFSPPAESAWLGWYAAAQEYSGFLRWAYNSWTADPLHETFYPAKSWAAGDCFLVYPGPRSSIRFERLREGIQDYEKVRILRTTLKKQDDDRAREALKRLDATLSGFTYAAACKRPASEALRAGKGLLAELSREPD